MWLTTCVCRVSVLHLSLNVVNNLCVRLIVVTIFMCDRLPVCGLV